MNELPTEHDFRKLPLRSLVAYVTRAAMRTRPRLRSPSAAPAIDEAIGCAAAFANNEMFDLEKAREVEDATVEALKIASDPKRGDRASALVANVAYAAVNAAVRAAEAALAPSPMVAAASVVTAAVTATSAARSLDTYARHGLARDFQTLANRARAPFPQPGAAVDPGHRGPLERLDRKPINAF